MDDDEDYEEDDDDRMEERLRDPVLVEPDEDERFIEAFCKCQPRYFWKDYREQMGKHEELRNDLVARAPNGQRYTLTATPEESYSRNVVHCPTYGNCCHCLGSGPIGMFCQTCWSDQRYRMIYADLQRVIVDAEWLSLVLWRPHLRAESDRVIMWTEPPSANFDFDLMARIAAVPYFRHENWIGKPFGTNHPLFENLEKTIYQDSAWESYLHPSRYLLGQGNRTAKNFDWKFYGEDREWQPIPYDWRPWIQKKIDRDEGMPPSQD